MHWDYELLSIAGVNTDLGMQELLEIEKKIELDSTNLESQEESQLYIDKMKHCVYWIIQLGNISGTVSIFGTKSQQNDTVVWWKNKQAKD